MRRGLIAISLTLTACAAVTGLGEYDVVDDPADAAMLIPSEAASLVDASPIQPVDAMAREDASVIADAAADATIDAGPAARGVACQPTVFCSPTPRPLCCIRQVAADSFTAECVEVGQCDGSRYDFACDDQSDCPSGDVCCADLANNGIVQSTACKAKAACPFGTLQTIACRANAECAALPSSGPPTSKKCESFGTRTPNLPDLKMCR